MYFGTWWIGEGKSICFLKENHIIACPCQAKATASSFSEFIVTSKVSLVILIKLSFVCQSLLNTWHQERELQCWLLCFSFTFLLLFFIPSTLIAEKVTKICDPNGNWFRHPESNRTWTNYTQCNIYTHEKVKVGEEWVCGTSAKKLNWKSLQVSKLKKQEIWSVIVFLTACTIAVECFMVLT